jgi:hypothetical protein
MPQNPLDENLRLRELMTRLAADAREIRAKMWKERHRSRQLRDQAARCLRERHIANGLRDGPSETRGGNPN